jgi:hypothetical protein
MTNRLDHFMWAAPDLDAAIGHFEDLSGVRALLGGVHPGRGTRNALAALGPDIYLEIIAPDPAQDLGGTFGGELAQLDAPQILAFMIKSGDLERTREAYASHGIVCDGPFAASRRTDEGALLAWRLLAPEKNDFGKLAPIAIDWQDSPHPAASAPSGCRLEAFEAGTPNPGKLAELYGALGTGVAVARADRPYLRAVLSTPEGRLVLTSA